MAEPDARPRPTTRQVPRGSEAEAEARAGAARAGAEAVRRSGGSLEQSSSDRGSAALSRSELH